MPLPFYPACLPLSLGALPYRSAVQALDVARRCAGTLLAWPQLPQRSFREQCLVQSIIGFPGLVVDAAAFRVYVDRREAERRLDALLLAYLEHTIDYAALSADDAAGLAEIVRIGGGRDLRAVKGQILGPISVALQLTDEHEQPLIYDDMLFDAIAHMLRLRVAWQELRLSEIAPATIMCIDEPLLEAVASPFFPHDWDRVAGQIDDVLAGISGCRALYTRGNVDLNHLMHTSVELLIAESAVYRRLCASGCDELSAFLERGGMVGIGIIPSDANRLASVSVDSLFEEFASLLDDFTSQGVARDRMLQQMVISPAQSLGYLDSASAERALYLLAGVSQRIREEYALI
ncbi:hypothetical protein [Roseiflexus sp.]|uniref:hypothetical protein n=1 Tax=Roseiflexus sp. TaxID=2562120 RepID=UPI0021DC100A|nr:hypothetical protein [Roseiflexus sp.]GIV99053.1 MAG: hypothetical protein KatS3mg058_0457 [Roseiflexus sp.]